MISTEFTGWRKARASGDNGQGCVEVGYATDRVGIRDTKLGETSPVLAVTAATFGELQHAIRDGRLAR